MSTHHYFICNLCKKKSNWSFTGVGGANIIDTFRFLQKHADCELYHGGRMNIKLLKESDPKLSAYDEDTDDNLNDYFPFSSEWRDKNRIAREYEKYKKNTRKIFKDILTKKQIEFVLEQGNPLRVGDK